MIKPIEVKITGEYRIFVSYSDGMEGEINLAHLKNNPEYKFMEDQTEFGKVYISSVTSDLCWSNGISLCKDAIYKQLELKSLMKRLKIDLDRT